MQIIPPIRDTDSWGSGAYGAKRGGRTHRGVDVSAYAGSVVLSDINGKVKRIGHPYNPTGQKRFCLACQHNIGCTTRCRR